MNDADSTVVAEPAPDKAALRRRLLGERRAMRDRQEREERLGEVLRAELDGRTETVIGAYWPIRAEFDPLPALLRWSEGGSGRRIGLPVVEPRTRQMRFHAWYPGCPMEDDAHGIPEPRNTDALEPQLLLVPCVGFGPKGVRLGYGGGYYDHTLPVLVPRPHTLGLCYAIGFVASLVAEPHDVPLDAILTEDGVAWPPRA